MKNEGKLHKITKWTIVFVVITLLVVISLVIIQSFIAKRNRKNEMTDNRDAYIKSLLSQASTKEDYDEIKDTIESENFVPQEDYFNMGEDGYDYLKKLFKTDYNYVEVQPLYIQAIVTIHLEDMFSKTGIDEKGTSIGEYIVSLKNILKSLEDTEYCHTRIKLVDSENEIGIEWNISSKGLDVEKPILVIPYFNDDSAKSLEYLDKDIKVVDGEIYTTEDFERDCSKYDDVEPATLLLKQVLEHIKSSDYFRINVVKDVEGEINTFRFCTTLYSQSDFVYIQDNVKSLNKTSEQYRYLYTSGVCSEGFFGKLIDLIK